MSKKSDSVVKTLAWGAAADVLLFATAILLMSAFAFSAFSSAYIVVLVLLASIAISYIFYKRYKKRNNS